MSEFFKTLKEKFEVSSKVSTNYYVSFNAQKYLGVLNLPENSENNEEFVKELNEFLKEKLNCKAIFAKINIYIMPI